VSFAKRAHQLGPSHRRTNGGNVCSLGWVGSHNGSTEDKREHCG
jgi:hypothetical protein